MGNNAAPVILSGLDLEVRFGEQVILNKASLTIHEGDRIGLVGRNGAGKSTFLKIIAGIMTPDSGEVARRKNLITGFLSQEFTLDDNATVYKNISSNAQREIDLIKEYESTPFDSPGKHLLEETILRMDSWNLEKRIGMLINALDAPDADRVTGTLSGGEKRRVALCGALISRPDLLILDEPTNHLDTKSIEWLEDFLKDYTGTCVFVTHDRYFLDNIANRIVELSSGEFYSHQGNYTDYLENKSARLTVLEVEERKRQSFLKRELEWVRRGPRARRTKSKSRLDNFYEAASNQGYQDELDIELIIPKPDRLGKKVAEIKNTALKMGNKILFRGFNFKFDAGRKIGVVGPNGSGKTSLLRMILGDLPPYEGVVETGENVQFNYVDQARLHLNDEDTVIKAIGEGSEVIKFGKQKISVWTYLRRFLFSDDRINTKVGKLSGGEKSRLTLAKILSTGGNFILLDEPTNDLDLPTLRILEEALIAFEGCVVIVSHDRYFLNRICDGILAFENTGEIYFSEGDYDYYIQKKKLRQKEEDLLPLKNKKEDTRDKQKTKKLTYKESKELEEIEDKILDAESEVGRIEKIFTSHDFYERYAAQTKELTQQLEDAKEKVHELYKRWEELESKKLDL